jgi:pimeloyl-ACP methyl ester carboxylesterase
MGGGRAFWWLRLRFRPGGDDPRHERDLETRRLRRPDGSEIHVEFRGPPDGPPVVLTHGWGLDATAWYYLRRRLGDRFRVIAWDLPGLGRSTGPANRDFSLDKFAADLRAVLAEAGGRPAVLVGHSIGGMITLNLCKLFPEELDGRVAGLVLVHTSPTNPLRMTEGRSVLAPLQKPVVEPLAYLMVALAPVVWVMNLLSYLNGSTHRSNHKQLFDGTETWGQLEFVTRFVPFVWPATYARGMLGMFRWDATDALSEITVPTLVVAAAGDRVTLPEASEVIRDRCPSARLVTLKPAGHAGLIERHEEFGRAVEAFAAECAAGHAATAGSGR